MDMNYFLKRLQAGEDMCDIGNEIAELMNEAQAAYDDEVRAKEEALAKELAEKEAAQAKKTELAKQICDLIAQYGAMECPEFADMFIADEDDFKALADSMTSIFSMMKLFGAAPAEMKTAKSAHPVVAVRSDDDILNDFVKNFLA